jgi:hemerythrin-like metal-binding protein
MTFQQWDRKYSVGVPTLDAQHQNLFRMINAMQEAMLHGGARERLSEIVAELLEAVQLHFAREEMILRANHYPGLVEHRKKHRAFLEELEGFEEAMKSGASSLTIELMNFLRHWLQTHVAEEDLQYRQWLLPK